MSTDQSLMTGKIFSCVLQAELLRPLSGQPAFFHIFWIKTQNVMMGFDFIIGLIFTVLCVQFFTFHIKSKRITVDAVQVIFFTGNQPAILIQDRLHGIFIILKHQITLCLPIIGIFTGDMLQDCHGRSLLSDQNHEVSFELRWRNLL